MRHSIFVFCVIVMCKGNKLDGLKLNQVLIFSRHNIRTPLTTNLEIFSSNKTWPKFNDENAQLIRKGALMENYMADYFAEWLVNEDFMKGCPKQEEVYIYSNTRSRTRVTAKAFAEAAFPSCNISINHNKNINLPDPVFHLILHNKSEYFIQQVKNAMENTLKETDLTESYLELNNILDLQNSVICKQKGLCDFSKMKTQIVYEEVDEPNVSGSLFFGNQIVDAFLMSFYEGFPHENVAWGKITTDEKWKLLTKITKHNLNVRFNKFASQDLGKPLLNHMFDIFRSGNPKLTVLVGHDSNICVIVNALHFKDFILKNQHEPFPIGGKVVFQKCSDGSQRFLKIEYVYLTFSQIRNGEKISLAQPPQKVLLELNDCKIDDRGLCPWEDFLKLNF